jgi:outer membrane murein-binding lipoprotein Lpp
MNKYSRIHILMLATVVLAGCAGPHVSFLPAHREDLSAQSRVLAVAARNLEDSVHRNRAEADQEEAAKAVAKFHAEAETFARVAGIWRDQSRVDKQFETLIEAWVLVQWTFPKLKPDGLPVEAYRTVEAEWEKTQRAGGYAGRSYQKHIEDKFGNERGPKPKLEAR